MSTVVVTHRRYFTTPGFLDHAAHRGPVNTFAISGRLLAAAPGEPSWVIGDPALVGVGGGDVGGPVMEDQGRTMRLAAPFKFYAIRDDHEEDCMCGCGGGSIVTFLLPEEY